MPLKNNKCDSKIFKAPSTSGFHSYRIKLMSVLGENPAGTL